MNPLAAAITMLEEELVQLQALMNKQQPGSDPYWWALQAKALGLSHLRSLQARGLEGPVQADQVRKLYRKELQPAAAEVAQEASDAPS